MDYNMLWGHEYRPHCNVVTVQETQQHKYRQVIQHSTSMAVCVCVCVRVCVCVCIFRGVYVVGDQITAGHMTVGQSDLVHTT